MIRKLIVAVAVGALVAACGDAPQESFSPVAGCPGEPQAEVGESLIAALPTDSGMHALWDLEAFRHICNFESWESELLADTAIERHIAAGRFVPLYVHSDGSPAIELRVGSASKRAGLRSGEDRWRVVSSKPYLFVSQGTITVSGIEYIGGPFEESRTLVLPEGRWSVTVYYLRSAEAERSAYGMYPPDFLVAINPEREVQAYRSSVETFDHSVW